VFTIAALLVLIQDEQCSFHIACHCKLRHPVLANEIVFIFPA
jgi:hypothetical protein